MNGRGGSAFGKSVLVPAAATAAVLIAGAALRTDRAMEPEIVETYHRQVADATLVLPYRYGDWVGMDVPVPEAAQKLLRPNVVFSRSYRNTETGVVCRVALVHCRDSRDMIGHYPPICYPANGWTASDDAPETSADLGARIYGFSRQSGGESAEITIWSFFEVPGRSRLADMDELREASDARGQRVLGAAQVQLVFDSGVPHDEQRAICEEFESMLMPVLEHVREWPS